MMRWVLALVLAIGLAAGLAAPATAMSFKMAKTQSGASVVLATGEIKKGDAGKLARALEKASRDKHGTKKILLHSPGGLVIEALKMADLISQAKVTTVIQKGAVCASACASILFVAGKYRTVEPGGALAIHSCYDSRTGKAASECNAMISMHAQNHGVSGKTMMSLQEAAGSEAIIVFDKEDAACFGLTLKPGAKASRKTPPCVAKALKELGR